MNAHTYTEGEYGTEGEPGKPGIGGGGEGGKGGKGGRGGRGALVILKRSRFQDASDTVLTILGVALIIAVAFAILQNRETAGDLERHSEIQSQASVDSCFQRNAQAPIVRKLLLALRVHAAGEPRVLEAIETYLANVEDTTPRLSECRELATELELEVK